MERDRLRLEAVVRTSLIRLRRRVGGSLRSSVSPSLDYAERLHALKLPGPPASGVEEWCRQIGEERGRPIRIRRRAAADLAAVVGQPATSEAAPCGLWLATPDVDYIVVDEAAPRILREHTILHELAHLLLQHDGMDVDPGQEYEAEMVADMLAQIAANPPPSYRIRRIIGRPGPIIVRDFVGVG